VVFKYALDIELGLIKHPLRRKRLEDQIKLNDLVIYEFYLVAIYLQLWDHPLSEDDLMPEFARLERPIF
jgi:hypothetical protein